MSKIDKVPTGPKPEVGQEVYLPTQGSISHGENDIAGGLSEICKIGVMISDGQPIWCVFVKEIPGRAFNYTILLRDQEENKKLYGNQRARPDPDYHDYDDYW